MSGKQNKKKSKILIAEDNNIIALDLKSRLDNLGYQVFEPVASGCDAATVARKQNPDLVLMDIKLRGDVDGIEAAEDIKRQLDIPIVYLTAYADRETLTRAKLTRPFGYILKPFDDRSLDTTIEMALYAHEMEMALRESEDRFRSLFEANQDSTIVIDMQERIILANRAAENMFNRRKGELVYNELYVLITAESRKKYADTIHDLMSKDSPGINGISIELIAQRSSAESFPADVSFSIGKTEKVKFGLVVFHDITERKRGEEMLQQALKEARAASHAKSEFLTNITHEIRTPMNSIIGMTELALNSNLNKDQREYLEIIKYSADSLLFLLNSLLDFSSIETGKMELEKTELDLRQILEETLKSFSSQVSLKELELRLEIDEDIPKKLIGDLKRVRQIVKNLIGNAVKFTEDGNIKIRVCVSEHENSDDHARYKNDSCIIYFSVEDTGIGIPENELESVFDTFRQVDGTYTRKFGGAGLGLAVTKGIVHLLGGKIWVSSELDKGSIFHFTIPFQIPPSSKSVRIKGKSKPGKEKPEPIFNEYVQENLPAGRDRYTIADGKSSSILFKEAAASKLDKLRSAIRAGNCDLGEMYASRLRKMAQNVGENGVRKAAFKVILAIRKGNASRIAMMLDLLEYEVIRITDRRNL